MYYHVIENTKRDGVSCYRKVKTYKSFTYLVRFLFKEGKPVWIITSREAADLDRCTHLGGCVESYYNTGGFGSITMPVFPFWHGR